MEVHQTAFRRLINFKFAAPAKFSRRTESGPRARRLGTAREKKTGRSSGGECETWGRRKFAACPQDFLAFVCRPVNKRPECVHMRLSSQARGRLSTISRSTSCSGTRSTPSGKCCGKYQRCLITGESIVKQRKSLASFEHSRGHIFVRKRKLPLWINNFS